MPQERTDTSILASDCERLLLAVLEYARTLYELDHTSAQQVRHASAPQYAWIDPALPQGLECLFECLCQLHMESDPAWQEHTAAVLLRVGDQLLTHTAAADEALRTRIQASVQALPSCAAKKLLVQRLRKLKTCLVCGLGRWSIPIRYAMPH